MEFLDRIDERRRLLRFIREAEGGVACVYGRRRIGKSRLLDEVLGEKENVVFYCADRSEAALQRARMAKDVSRMLSGFADVVYSGWRSFFERWQREAPHGSVLVIDELPYLVERSPELPSILQKIADNLRKTGQKLVLCGSSQRMMQGLVMDVSEPLYGCCRVILKLAPIGYPWLKKASRILHEWNGSSITPSGVAYRATGRFVKGSGISGRRETKLKQTKLEAEHALAELKVKAKLLPSYAQYEKVVCRLFVADSARAGEVTLGWAEEDEVDQ